MRDFPPAVVVHVHGSPYGESSAKHVGHLSGETSGAPTPVAPLDPYQVHRDFPERWRGYLHANFRSHCDVQQAFQVSEKTARNWWTGATGANGGHVAVAVRIHPHTAPQMLFAAE